MIGKKEINLITTGKKIVDRHKKNFSEFTNHDFFVRISLVDPKTGLFVKAVEYIVNSADWMDYVSMADFGDYKVVKVEFSADGR